MSTMVRSIDEGKALAAHMAAVDPEKTAFAEDPSLQVLPAWAALTDGATAEGREARRRALADQKGFRFKNCDGVEVAIVIAPFRDGYCVWCIGPNGMAVRF